MALPRELSAISINKPAERLTPGEVIRFTQDTVTTTHSGGCDITSQVFVGRVGSVEFEPILAPDSPVNVNVDLLGRFDFQRSTMVEVILDPLGMSLPYGEDIDLEADPTPRASHAVTDLLHDSER